jgi:hypothetical protein
MMCEQNSEGVRVTLINDDYFQLRFHGGEAELEDHDLPALASRLISPLEHKIHTNRADLRFRSRLQHKARVHELERTHTTYLDQRRNSETPKRATPTPMRR